MRQIFSSPRLENVEGVVQLLGEAGIQVRVTHGRGFEGPRRRRFSYSDQESPLPTVWVVNSADQVRAREILRDAGLLDTTRPGASTNANAFRFDPLTQAVKPQRRVLLVKVALLVGIVTVLVLAVLRALSQPSVPQLASPPFDGSVARTLEPVARAVFASQLKDANFPVLCLSVDGADAPATMIAALKDPGRQVVPASECARVADSDRGSFHGATNQEALLLDVTAFRPSAPDVATVEYSAYHHRMSGRYKSLEVKRTGGEWRVTRVLKHVST